MLKGGVILDVTNAEQARIAEDAGAAAVMALERVPADIRREGGVARMAAIERDRGGARRGLDPGDGEVPHRPLAEARVLEALGVDFIDESEVLTPADDEHHVDKHAFRVPFVCGARDLGEALRRIGEGAAMIRTKGEAGSGNIVEAVRHLRQIGREMRALAHAPRRRAHGARQGAGAPYELVRAGRGAPAAAGAELRRRRHRHAGRRRALHGARRRGGVRRLGRLQVRRSGGAGARHRPRHHALAGPGRGAGRLARPRRRRWRASRMEAIPDEERLARAGMVRRSASSPSRATSPPTRAPSRAAASRASPCARRPISPAIDALVLPGGESTAMLHGIARDGLEAPLRAFLASGRPVLGTCAGAILLARHVTEPAAALVRRARHRRRAQRLRHADRLVREPWRMTTIRLAVRRPALRLHPRAAHRPRRARASRCLRASTARRCWSSSGPVWAATFHPELTDDLRVVGAVFGSAVSESRFPLPDGRGLG